MSFDVGDKVVYPHHGAAVIQRRELRAVSGADREYLVLHMAFDELTLRVPVDSIDSVASETSSTTRKSPTSTPCWQRKTSALPRTGLGDSRTTPKAQVR